MAKHNSKFVIFKSEADGKHYFHLLAGNGKVILGSEGYDEVGGAKKGVSVIKKIVADATTEIKK